MTPYTTYLVATLKLDSMETVCLDLTNKFLLGLLLMFTINDRATV